jgi:hypothetical protein
MEMMDVYEVEVIMSDLMRQIEDLAYRVSSIEDSVAELNAYKEEGEVDA